MLVKTD